MNRELPLSFDVTETARWVKASTMSGKRAMLAYLEENLVDAEGRLEGLKLNPYVTQKWIDELQARVNNLTAALAMVKDSQVSVVPEG